ncbi:hypothetical protein BDQ17DRAFT_1408435 [Cyathus striatus]|nr:hypothetical protein BDQ17DRAFT_1408435 [Cyathus striatus]
MFISEAYCHNGPSLCQLFPSNLSTHSRFCSLHSTFSMSITADIIVARAEEKKEFSPFDYPRTILPIERYGKREYLEIVFTSRLLFDEELIATGYRFRAWAPEHGSSFPYAMAKRPRKGIDYSIIIYCPEAYTRSFVDIPAFKIFDLQYNPPAADEFPSAPEGESDSENECTTVHGPSPYNITARGRQQFVKTKELNPRPIKPLPGRRTTRTMTGLPGEDSATTVVTGFSIEKKTNVGACPRPLKRKFGKDNNAPSLHRQPAAMPYLTSILASILSAIGLGPASQSPRCNNEEDTENGVPRKRSRRTA